jgi:hypothetical protein
MITNSPFLIAPNDSTSPRGEERMDARVRQVLRGVSRHLNTLSGCQRTSDRTLVDNISAFTADRHLHTFALDSRAVIGQIEGLSADAVPMTLRARELLAALHSYLVYLQGVLVIEPPAFALPGRQIDLRCVAFLPEVEAFNRRIEDLAGAGGVRR